MTPLQDVLRPWHDFYSLMGTASATLIGLLFVAASVGSGFYTPERLPAARSFLSPSVVHFASVLAACLFAMVPLHGWTLFGLLIGADGVFGIAYSGLVLRNMLRHGFFATVDLEDRVWYVSVPAVSHLLIAAAGGAFVVRADIACGVLALGTGLLMLAVIRNAWDITIWMVTRRPG